MPRHRAGVALIGASDPFPEDETMSDTTYHAGMRTLQDRFDTRRLADRLDERLGRGAFSEADKAFIESRTMFFLATADAEGRPDCSYKGGNPGFVRVTGPAELEFPSYDGNGQFRPSGCCSSTSSRRGGCASTGMRRCSTIPSRWHATTVRSSSCACGPGASFRTARAISTRAAAPSCRPTCRASATSRRWRRGSR